MSSAFSHTLPSRYQDGLLQEAEQFTPSFPFTTLPLLSPCETKENAWGLLQCDHFLSSSASGCFATYPSVLDQGKCSVTILKHPENCWSDFFFNSFFSNNKVPKNSAQGGEFTYFTSSVF